ncbi:hypothetical protein [Sulfurimonas sp.]|uniref:hypothetical protein n=1 Tax=Sulfurimonas sp. TaxID=2022749 RepID=UPI003D0ED4F1
MKKISTIIIYFLCSSSLFSSSNYQNIEQLAKSLKLFGGTKASVQWEKIFSSQRHLKRYHLEHLDHNTKEQLQHYLIQHAADSKQPIVPGV